MNKACYRSLHITGLRSNPKLCGVHDYGCEVIVDCGLACGHSQSSLITKENRHQKEEVINLLKKNVIKLHDQWMKDNKRYRIREGNVGAVPNRPSPIRRPSIISRWFIDPPVARTDS